MLALVATLAALAALGRVAFAPLPNVKPTTDIVLLAGFALGGAPGFAVGAVAALASNLVFGQGPWTPWQMAAWGLCGVFGAALGRRQRAAPGPRAAGRSPAAWRACCSARSWTSHLGDLLGRATRSAQLPGHLRDLAAFQHRPRRRQRRLLPRLRSGAPARPDALPLALRGPLARRAGAPALLLSRASRRSPRSLPAARATRREHRRAAARASAYLRAPRTPTAGWGAAPRRQRRPALYGLVGDRPARRRAATRARGQRGRGVRVDVRGAARLRGTDD